MFLQRRGTVHNSTQLHAAAENTAHYWDGSRTAQSGINAKIKLYNVIHRFDPPLTESFAVFLIVQRESVCVVYSFCGFIIDA